MSNHFAELAQEIHKRDNKKTIGPCVGTVTREAQPIAVTICDGAVILEQGDNALVCQNLMEGIKQGDQVLCIPCTGEQTWIITDRVVG